MYNCTVIKNYFIGSYDVIVLCRMTFFGVIHREGISYIPRSKAFERAILRGIVFRFEQFRWVNHFLDKVHAEACRRQLIVGKIAHDLLVHEA